jgi:hypothetical protein
MSNLDIDANGFFALFEMGAEGFASRAAPSAESDWELKTQWHADLSPE